MAITFLAGNRAIGTNAERLAITTTNIQSGLEFHETDTNKDYVLNSVGSINSATFTMSGVTAKANIDTSYAYRIVLTNDYTLANGSKFVGFEVYTDTSGTNYHRAIYSENFQGAATTNTSFSANGTASGTASFTQTGTSFSLTGHGGTLTWTSNTNYDLRYVVVFGVYQDHNKPNTSYAQGTFSGLNINNSNITLSSSLGSFHGSPYHSNATFMSWAGSTATIKGLMGSPRNIWYFDANSYKAPIWTQIT